MYLVNGNLVNILPFRLLLSQRQQAFYAREADFVRQIKDAEVPDDLEVIVW